MKSIAVIVFYFGKFPWYHNYFIESCKRNQSIDFLFFTDNCKEKNSDINITYFPLTIDEFNRLASKKLGFNINVQNGLKICDLRPSFGLIFEEFIKNYDFWGYSDTDIILGNLRNFLDEDVLLNDYISVKDSYPSGFFSIFKNNSKVNYLFKKSKDYQLLFQMKENTLFEECGGAYEEVCNGINILESSCKYETFHHILEKNKDSIASLFEFYSIEGNVGTIEIDHDKMIFLKEYEVMMYHLTNFKSNLFSIIPNQLLTPKFCISKYSFSKKSSVLSFQIFFINLKKVYLFNFAKFIAKPMSSSNEIRLDEGTYTYMNENVTISQNCIFNQLSDNTKFSILKIPFFSKFFLVDDTVLSVISRNEFDVYSKTGLKRNFKLSNDTI